MKAHFILYVADQEAATGFYSGVLGLKPSLHVPGMTEFALNEGCVLGLMPERGIKRLLGDRLPDPAQANGIPRAEAYLLVTDPRSFLHRALERGALELSPVLSRDWGHLAGYCLDPDGHVIAFACLAEN
jgi:catechol 2,3-dioxygenase-like lactoylglutathione lyase family enzyme